MQIQYIAVFETKYKFQKNWNISEFFGNLTTLKNLNNGITPCTKKLMSREHSVCCSISMELELCLAVFHLTTICYFKHH